MTQPAAPTPVLPLQYDNTRPDTLVRVVRLFCWAQIAGSVLVIGRAGLQLASGGFLRGGYPAGVLLQFAQAVAYNIGPFAANVFLLVACLLALQLNPVAFTWGRLYCLAAWASSVVSLVVGPYAMWTYFTSRAGGTVYPSLGAIISGQVIGALAGVVFPTALHFAMRIPALRDLFRAPSADATRT